MLVDFLLWNKHLSGLKIDLHVNHRIKSVNITKSINPFCFRWFNCDPGTIHHGFVIEILRHHRASDKLRDGCPICLTDLLRSDGDNSLPSFYCHSYH